MATRSKPAYLVINYQGKVDRKLDQILEQRLHRKPTDTSLDRRSRTLEWSFPTKGHAVSVMRSLRRLSTCGFLIYVTV